MSPTTAHHTSDLIQDERKAMRDPDRKRKTGYPSFVNLEPSFNIKSPHTPGTRKKMLAFILFNFQMYAFSTTLQSVFLYLTYKVMKR